MRSRLGLLAVLVLVSAAPAGADTIFDKQRAVDQQIARLNDRLDETRARETSLKGDLEAFTEQIRELAGQVSTISEQLASLQQELEIRELKLKRLNALHDVQTERFQILRRQYAVALDRLNARLVAMYEEDQVDFLELVLSSRSFTEFLDALDYMRAIGKADKAIAERVADAKARVRAARKRTGELRDQVGQEARVVAMRVSQARDIRDQLLASKEHLEGARSARRESLVSVSAQEREALEEIAELAKVSAQLAEQIRAAQGGGIGAPSVPAPAGGFAWPVPGPVTSPFGWRWGRMHEGIDIGAPAGAPVVASAAGTVIYAGELGGYGNLVVIDHGGGLATAYGHMAAIGVASGQQVGQGEAVGLVGSTGHSTGPHLHFEVRVNGSPVDPLGYL
jgi:murein DD-endopeptidase MepM/ murein hydrolase activator NlpD